MPLARNTFLRTIVEYAETVGVRREDLLQEIDLDAALIDQPGAFIDAAKLIDAVAYAARASGRNDFGMMLGAQNDHRTLGPVGLLIEHCRTVVDAVAEGSRYLHLHNAALTYKIKREGANYAFRVGIGAQGRYDSAQYVELLLTMAMRFFRLMLGERWAPLYVTFAHRRQAGDLAYRRAFGAEVRFGEHANAVVAAKADFERKLPQGDPRIRRVVERMLDEIDREQSENIVAKLAPIMRPLLATGHAHAADVARVVQLSPRTLQRRLAEAGTSFQEVLDSVRLEIAREYLPRPGMTLARLAPIIGFSEASAVSRFLRDAGGVKGYKRRPSPKPTPQLKQAFAAWGN